MRRRNKEPQDNRIIIIIISFDEGIIKEAMLVIRLSKDGFLTIYYPSQEMIHGMYYLLFLWAVEFV